MRVPRAALAAVSALASMVCAPPAAAQGVTVAFADGGEPLFAVTAPDGWIVSTGTPFEATGVPRVMGLHPEEDLSLWIGMMSPPDVISQDEAEDYLTELGRRLLDDAEVDALEPGDLNGVAGRRIAGRGTREGAPVDFAAFVGELPSDRWLIVLFIGEYGAREVYAEDIEALRASFETLSGAAR